MIPDVNPQQTLMPNLLRRVLPTLLLCAVTGLGTSGCIYRMAIQQGNYLDAAQVAQLEAGMTRSQVAFLLGTPMIPSGFDNDRWDYFYYLKDRRNHPADERRVTVYFKDDKVDHVTQGPDKGEAPHIGLRNRS